MSKPQEFICRVNNYRAGFSLIGPSLKQKPALNWSLATGFDESFSDTSIRNYTILEKFYVEVIMLVGCRGVFRWSKAKFLVKDKHVSRCRYIRKGLEGKVNSRKSMMKSSSYSLLKNFFEKNKPYTITVDITKYPKKGNKAVHH